MISNNHIRYERHPEEEVEHYRHLYRWVLAFWLPLAAAVGVIVGHFLI